MNVWYKFLSQIMRLRWIPYMSMCTAQALYDLYGANTSLANMLKGCTKESG